MVDSNLIDVKATQLPRDGSCKSRQRRLPLGLRVTSLVLLLLLLFIIKCLEWTQKF